jgi:hypothetical protein
MDFFRVLQHLSDSFRQADIHYALIGGFAMAMHGVQRATVDLDFILLLDDLHQADQILSESGYQRHFHSENVSHYRAADAEFGRIDILHAFRPAARAMLERAEQISIDVDVVISVAQIEDVIGLKIQAASNNPARQVFDWYDIKLLLEAAAAQQKPLDFALMRDYVDVFDVQDRYQEMIEWYGQTKR